MTARLDQSGAERQLTVRLFASLRDLFGWKESQVSIDRAPDVARLLEVVCVTVAQRRALFDEGGKIASGVIVLLNGRHVALRGGAVACLKGGDEVSIFPPIFGG